MLGMCLRRIFGVVPHASPSAPGEILHFVPEKQEAGTVSAFVTFTECKCLLLMAAHF